MDPHIYLPPPLSQPFLSKQVSFLHCVLLESWPSARLALELHLSALAASREATSNSNMASPIAANVGPGRADQELSRQVQHTDQNTCTNIHSFANMTDTVTIKTETTHSFTVHTSLLLKESLLFRQQEDTISENKTIDLPAPYKTSIFVLFISYLYTNDLSQSITTDDGIDAYKLGKYLKAERFTELCYEFCQSRLLCMFPQPRLAYLSKLADLPDDPLKTLLVRRIAELIVFGTYELQFDPANLAEEVCTDNATQLVWKELLASIILQARNRRNAGPGLAAAPFSGSTPADNQTSATFGNSGSTAAGHGGTSGSTGGLFGHAQSSNGTRGSLFDNNTTPRSTGGLFGQPQASNTTTGGLVGNRQSNNGTGGGLFGKPQANTNTGSLFGSTQANQNNGSTFGNAHSNQNSGGSLSSNTGCNNSSGGLFGRPGNNASLFGSTANQASTAGGLFGTNKNPNNTTSGSGLFGQSRPSPFSAFGVNTSTSGTAFGGAPQPRSPFGPSQPNRTSDSLNRPQIVNGSGLPFPPQHISQPMNSGCWGAPSNPNTTTRGFGSGSGNNTGFGAAPATTSGLFGGSGTGHASGLGSTSSDPSRCPGTLAPFQPFLEQEPNGTTVAFQSIGFHQPNQSHEELRLQDYQGGRQYPKANEISHLKDAEISQLQAKIAHLELAASQGKTKSVEQATSATAVSPGVEQKVQALEDKFGVYTKQQETIMTKLDAIFAKSEQSSSTTEAPGRAPDIPAKGQAAVTIDTGNTQTSGVSTPELILTPASSTGEQDATTPRDANEDQLPAHVSVHAKKVYPHLKTAPETYGFHVQLIALELKMQEIDVRKAMEELVELGLAHTTFDEHHFAAIES